jgi:hypothetical protein
MNAACLYPLAVWRERKKGYFILGISVFASDFPRQIEAIVFLLYIYVEKSRVAPHAGAWIETLAISRI